MCCVAIHAQAVKSALLLRAGSIRWGGGFTTIVVYFALAQSVQAASVLSGPEVNPSNGHSYYLLTSDFWGPSEDAAVALGGHLVTVNDQTENDWVFDTFALFDGESRTLWTGYHRLAPAGPFVWVSGDPISFENWFPGEPNNSTGTEDYAAFVPTAQSSGKQWFDMFASTTYNGTPIHGVVEAVPVLPGDFNGNGAVENADLTLLLNNWSQPVPPTPPGWIGTPLTAPAVNNDELTALLNNWGRAAGHGGSTVDFHTVPEPTAFVGPILAIGLLLHGRRWPARECANG